MIDKILEKAAEFERRAETPTNLMTSAEFMFVAAALRELVALREEVRKLRERLGPRGLEVIFIDGAGHYVNEKVKAEIERLRGVAQAEPEPSSRYVGPRMYQQEKYGK